MTAGPLFTYMKTYERDRDKDFEQRLRVYKVVRYKALFSCGP